MLILAQLLAVILAMGMASGHSVTFIIVMMIIIHLFLFHHSDVLLLLLLLCYFLNCC